MRHRNSNVHVAYTKRIRAALMSPGTLIRLQVERRVEWVCVYCQFSWKKQKNKKDKYKLKEWTPLMRSSIGKMRRARVVLIKQRNLYILIGFCFRVFVWLIWTVDSTSFWTARSGQCSILLHFICFANWKRNGHRNKPKKKNKTKEEEEGEKPTTFVYFRCTSTFRRTKTINDSTLNEWCSIFRSLSIGGDLAVRSIDGYLAFDARAIPIMIWYLLIATNCILSTLIE